MVIGDPPCYMKRSIGYVTMVAAEAIKLKKWVDGDGEEKFA